MPYQEGSYFPSPPSSSGKFVCLRPAICHPPFTGKCDGDGREELGDQRQHTDVKTLEAEHAVSFSSSSVAVASSAVGGSAGSSMGGGAAAGRGGTGGVGTGGSGTAARGRGSQLFPWLGNSLFL
ncbi:unnamed protein product [Closterium sp. Naga37s-1]|nr:unnamed protein product [Closterium sp. Naga37s-1]